MLLEEILDSQKKEYNNFVAAQNSGSFLQSFEWGQWQEKLGYKVYRYWFMGTSEKPLGSIQLIKIPLPFNQYYLYCPYGPVISNDQEQGFSQWQVEFYAEIKTKFPKAIFLRTEPKFLVSPESLKIYKNINIQPGKTIIISLSQEENVLLESMHHKTRYNVRLAERHGVVVESEILVTPKYGLYIKEVVDLILQTQNRQNYKGHTKKYYMDMIDFFVLSNKQGDLKLVIYKALLEKKLLAAAIMIDFGPTRLYLFGGSCEESRQVMAPYLLHWKAMIDAKTNGLLSYDLGGSEVSGGGERGFTRFKQGFGGKEVVYGGAWDVVFKIHGYFWYKILRKLNRLKQKIF